MKTSPQVEYREQHVEGESKAPSGDRGNTIAETDTGDLSGTPKRHQRPRIVMRNESSVEPICCVQKTVRVKTNGLEEKGKCRASH